MSDSSNTTSKNNEPWYAPGLSFTCTQCGNCCTGPEGFVWYTDEEADAIADYLNISRGEFNRRYTKKVHNMRSLSEMPSPRGYDCVFLRFDEQGKALCSIYPVRPAQCRSWPFWKENLRSKQAWLRASQNCPGMKAGMDGDGEFFPVDQIRIRRNMTENDL